MMSYFQQFQNLSARNAFVKIPIIPKTIRKTPYIDVSKALYSNLSFIIPTIAPIDAQTE